MLNKHSVYLKENKTIVISFLTTKKKKHTKSLLLENKRRKQQQEFEKEKDKRSWQRTLFP
jgi:hypothetical protein